MTPTDNCGHFLVDDARSSHSLWYEGSDGFALPEKSRRVQKTVLRSPSNSVGTKIMAFFSFLWTDEIVEHVAEHGLTEGDFEAVVNRPVRRGFSRSSGLPAAWGYTDDGRYIMAVYEEIDDITVLPVTAYEVPEPR